MGEMIIVETGDRHIFVWLLFPIDSYAEYACPLKNSDTLSAVFSTKSGEFPRNQDAPLFRRACRHSCRCNRVQSIAVDKLGLIQCARSLALSAALGVLLLPARLPACLQCTERSLKANSSKRSNL